MRLSRCRLLWVVRICTTDIPTPGSTAARLPWHDLGIFSCIPKECYLPSSDQAPVFGAEHAALAADAGLYGQAYSQSAAGGWRQLDDNAQWTGPSSLECSTMEGQRVVIDVDHYPTALQVCVCSRMYTLCQKLQQAGSLCSPLLCSYEHARGIPSEVPSGRACVSASPCVSWACPVLAQPASPS